MLKNPNAFALIQAYLNYGLVIDTNLLILDFVGNYDISKIEKFKRTRKYTAKDYFLLQSLIKSFRKVIYNQPILTEIFNLLDTDNTSHNHQLNRHLVNHISKLSENLNKSDEILGMKSFVKYGFADASIDLLSNYNLILTDDLKLFSYLAGQQKPVVNFNHIREL